MHRCTAACCRDIFASSGSRCDERDEKPGGEKQAAVHSLAWRSVERVHEDSPELVANDDDKPAKPGLNAWESDRRIAA